ncbi:MAG: ribbon-helix-helix protein, CopG family [Acidimicrobiaceae bacterium]|nr:ribbon-helix-helix protein, CopG family [Acidimicrobiaceae bacterium]
MTARKTATGRILTEADLDAIAEEVETSDYDIAALHKRRRGRPAMGSGPAEVVPVRIDLELRAAVSARAETDGTTTSEVIREALRRFLDDDDAAQAQHA